MDKIKQILNFYNKVVTDKNYCNDPYVRGELLEGIRLTLIKALKGANVTVKDSETLANCIELITENKLPVFDVLPLAICNEPCSNNQLLMILNSCVICVGRYTIEDKDLLITCDNNNYKIYADSSYILATKESTHEIILLGCRKEVTIASDLLVNIQEKLPLAIEDACDLHSEILKRLEEI